MVNFARMFLCASCLVTIGFEIILLINLSIYLSFMMQTWMFFEWLASKDKNKKEYDIVLHDLIPFLSQLILFYKIVN